MRKVLSFVLVLSLVLGSLGMAFATMPDVAGEDFEDAVNVLTDLGVVTGYPDGTYRPDNIVTRAEMAVIVVRALGLADFAVGTANFKDMAGHWSNPYVAYANALGVIAGYPDGTFRPDKTVSYDEAATMLVAALGYTPESLLGTWPANYVSKAKTLGILDGVVAGAAGANRGDVATMVFQTLDQNVGKTDNDGKWEATVLKDDGTTKTFDTMLGRLGAELKDDGDPFVLTSTDADSAVANVRHLVGAYVTAYINDDKIIGISEVKSVFLTGKYNGDKKKFVAGGVDYSFATAQTVGYTNALDVTVSSTAIVNGDDGALTNSAITGLTSEVTIAAKVSGKTLKEVYSVATWTVTDAAQVDKFDVEELAKDDKLFGFEFELDDNDEVDTGSFALYGVSNLSDIKVDDIVYVYENASTNTIARVEVGTEVVEGKITSSNSAKSKFTIAGTTYSKGFADTSHTLLVVGDEVRVFLDYSGDIFLVEKITGKTNYGIYLGAKAKDDDPIDKADAKVRLFLEDGTAKTFDVHKDTTTVASTGSIVKYSLNSDGVVNSFSVAATAGAIESGDITSKGYFDGKKVNADAVIFTYEGNEPLDAGNAATNAMVTSGAIVEDDLDVTTLANVLGSDSVSAAAVVNSSGLIVAMFMKGGTTEGTYGLVKAWGYNDSDEGAYVDLMLDGKDAVRYDAAVTGSAVELYKVTFKANGAVSALAKASTDGAIGVSVAGITGVAVKLDGYVVSYTTDGATTAASIMGGDMRQGDKYTLDEDVVVYVYSKADKYFKVGKLSDVRGKVTKIYLYDTDYDDPDSVYDVVMVWKQ